jgi:hypothetical protein
MMLAIGLSYIVFSVLRYIPSILRFLRAFIMKLCKLMKMKTQPTEPMGHSKGSPKRKVYSHE